MGQKATFGDSPGQARTGEDRQGLGSFGKNILFQRPGQAATREDSGRGDSRRQPRSGEDI
jgi:hypothetical protein